MEYAILVTWTDPEAGTSVYGPYDSRVAAEADFGRAIEDHSEDGQLPSDVEISVIPLWAPTNDDEEPPVRPDGPETAEGGLIGQAPY